MYRSCSSLLSSFNGPNFLLYFSYSVRYYKENNFLCMYMQEFLLLLMLFGSTFLFSNSTSVRYNLNAIWRNWIHKIHSYKYICMSNGIQPHRVEYQWDSSNRVHIKPTWCYQWKFKQTELNLIHTHTNMYILYAESFLEIFDLLLG